MSSDDSMRALETESLLYSPEFFDIQLTFAEKVAEVTKESDTPISLDEALTIGTCIRGELGMSDNDDRWEEFLTNLSAIEVRGEKLKHIHERYVEHVHSIVQDTSAPTWGPFYYHIHKHEGDTLAYIHFANRIRHEASPLSRDKISVRTEEIKDMISHIREQHPEIQEVMSISWVYNLNAMQRLFPAQFTATAKEMVWRGHFARMNLWGQFLRHDGSVNDKRVASFLNEVSSARKLEDLTTAFPFKPLFARCALEEFESDPRYRITGDE